MPSHPGAGDMRDYITQTNALAKAADSNDPEHGRLHDCINDVLDQMDREGGPSYGQTR